MWDMRRTLDRTGPLSETTAPVPLYVILPAVFLLAFLWFSVTGNRALRRLSHLSAASRVAVHAMCFATSDSLQNIKAYGARAQFMTTMQQLIDAKVILSV
jgi:hypothetical protein